MCKLTQELLLSDALSLSDRMICLSDDAPTLVKALLGEMRAYSIIIEPPRTAFGRSRHTFSGKIGGQQDDMIIALQLALLGTRMFRRSNAAEIAHRQGDPSDIF